MMEDQEDNLLADSVARALGDVVTARDTVAAEAEGIDARAWETLRDLGLVGEDAAALSLAEQAPVLQAIGHCAALVPYADSEALARWLAHGAGLSTDPGEVLAIVTAAPDTLLGRRIAWGRHAGRAVLSYSQGERSFVAIVPTEQLELAKGANLAGEPSDRCLAASVDPQDVREVGPEHAPDAVRLRGALCRCAAMLGAASRAQELTLQYAADRKQFGRPLAQFQVIQAYCAQMAGEHSAAAAMLATALRVAEQGLLAGSLEVAAAKVRVGQMAQVVAALAHQVHGAIAFTEEYALQLSTRRLWAWREEFGNEAQWSRELGSAVVDLGPDRYWERITS